ncbi:nitroreductase/quinone reductase family protein [Kribbella kalugense]|uniref:nitroreductase/quinone reductase family protein n=1 Tax=Kribbella kalugense TaxID=2512221 RepID=UPI00192D53A5|nr:nitroreductase/quinone reductase family protein [Kribbella kalugense]
MSSQRNAREAKRLHRFDRWLYRGGHPNGLARTMNRVSAIQFATGLFARRSWVTLDVPGRRTGRLISFPLVVADYQGERYLVSMLGKNANWVRNVHAACGRVILRHGLREAVYLESVEVDARAPILRRYLDCAPGALAHVPVDRHAPLAEFDRIAGQFPVFRISVAPSELPDLHR